MKRLTLLPLIGLSLVLSSCAVTTASIANGKERSVTRSLNDVSSIKVIKARFRRADAFKLENIDVEVAEGIVLLSGFAPREEDKLEAARIAWSAPNIREVGNEIMIGPRQTALSDTKDSVIHAKVRSKLVAEKSVISRNVNIEVHHGIVYLLGVARTPEELQRIATIASRTKGAREIVSYMTVHKGVAPVGSGSAVATLTPDQLRAAPNPVASSPIGGAAPIAGMDDMTGQRELPSFLTRTPEGATSLDLDPIAPNAPSLGAGLPSTPPGPLLSELPNAAQTPIDPTKPFYRDAITGEILDIDPNIGTIPFRPSEAANIGGPLAGQAKELLPSLPTQLPKAPTSSTGGYITGNPGDVLEETESAPYYIDPDTGKEIPVVFRPR